MDDQGEVEKRKRGGQPGNQNAVTHGLYARQLKGFRGEVEGSDGLKDQIAMLRLSVREMMRQAEAVESAESDLELLRVVTNASVAIHRLVKTQGKLKGSRTPEGGESQEPLRASPSEEVTVEDLSDARVARVDQEVALLTTLIERVTGKLGTWKSLEQSAAVVRGLAAANSVLASLSRTQYNMRPMSEEMMALIRAINLKNEEMDAMLKEGGYYFDD